MSPRVCTQPNLGTLNEREAKTEVRGSFLIISQNIRGDLTLSRAPNAASKVTPSFSPASCSTLRKRPWAASVASYSPPTNRTNSSALTIRSPSRSWPLVFRPEDEEGADVLFSLWTKESTYIHADGNSTDKGRCMRRQSIEK